MTCSKPKLLLWLLIMVAFGLRARGQDTSKLGRLISLPDKFFTVLDKKASSLEERLDKQTEKYLTRLQKQETRLKKKLQRKDSLLAKELFGDVGKRYADLKSKATGFQNTASVYSPRLDSVTTALSFLKDKNLTSSPEVQKTLAQYKSLQGNLNATDAIRKQMVQRQRMLKDQFQKLGMVKELKKFRKEVFYYQAQVKDFRNALEDPSKLQKKLLELALRLPQFKNFFASNSQLSNLFALPGSGPSNITSLAGLQTRASVSQILIDRFGSGPDATQALQQNVQAAQGQLGELKNKLSSLSTGSFGGGDDAMEMPKSFKPNDQKTKSLLKRMEVGTNIQSQKARYFFPVTSDLGLSLGYKLNDKSVVGLGASYKLGWGCGWNNISLTHQGASVRSFMDYKLKGSLFISGGYEQNYRSEITAVADLKDYSSWQTSGLLGVSKRYKAGKKLKGEMKLLWDFMSYKQIPKTQAIVFRVGYTLK